jgi:hypothetical protein
MECNKLKLAPVNALFLHMLTVTLLWYKKGSPSMIW